jgi:glycosyltransferase involved in cell wall biosynthesis
MFVKRFMACLKDEADDVYVTDTGSTDNTVDLLREEGAIVNVIKVDPWRFDVARNISLDLVAPDIDVVFCLDLDEVVTPGWRAAIEEAYRDRSIDRLRYKYVWNHLDDGSDGTSFWYDKIHTRRGFRWVKPVHEVLEFYNGTERQGFSHGFTLHHWPDSTKSRSSYLGLLELGVRESPNDDRNSHYLGREYMYYHMYDQAIAELKRHLELPTARWDAERSASMRYIGKSYVGKGDLAQGLNWLLRACAEAPGEREPWVELGRTYYQQENFLGCYYAMKSALAITERPMTYICEPSSYGADPYDLAGVSAYYLGLYRESFDLGMQALAFKPTDARIRMNVQFAEEKLG